MNTGGGEREPWLPDLCRLPRLVVMLSMAELIVVVLALAPDGGARWTWSRFVSGSTFALWLALTVSVLLCVSRERLSRLPASLGGLMAVAAAALIGAAFAAMTHSIDNAVGASLVPPGVTFWRFTLGTAAVSMLAVGVVLRYLYVNDSWKAQVRASARAEVDALQARIKPHFLFNSMNTIASLVRSDAVVAERAVLDLSDLFRAALGAGESDSSLAEEVELAERYLAIEQLRLGERLTVEWRKHEPLPWTLPMPRLVLQPLVENAVLHGVSRLPAGGAVEIELAVEGASLALRVRNPAPAPAEDADNGGTRHAQRSIGQRLRYAYGPQARMTAGWAQGYYLCELHVPTGVEALYR
ncbi:sensor histidine kinase [Lysobacter silvisoli]|uniref:Sensor histidine kinase n=1 Tax=Lysobacter silvisoli TaxID=2293254 RepID=A0A371K0L1_9GAMM|nr:histidine kinase [Lysobacter silvisoli]RDZ27390.1 sensor histidine kinase [Lysobacter silvisoli]